MLRRLTEMPDSPDRAIDATTKPVSGHSLGHGLGRVRQLAVVASPERDAARPYPLDGRPLVLGRAPSGERVITLLDDECSREHATIEHVPATDSYVVVDRESRNGTFVDGVRVERAPLGDGSVVRIGRTLLVFVDVALVAGEPLVAETAAQRGRSLRMQQLRGAIAQVAPHRLPVLVLGESGAGKERVAEAIHAASGRKGPYVTVNCATMPEALADNELFGHATGAFTGATAKHDGLFLAADGGTLFLDEVAELPATVQAKLLRTIATGEVRALGRSDVRKCDVRLVAATNKDVERAVAMDAFRGDLFARLAGFTIHVPPLRARRDDVLHLAASILARHGDVELSSSAAEALLLHDWPYNVRELENALGAAAVRAGEERRVLVSHLPPAVARRVAGRAPSVAPPYAPLEVRVPSFVVPDADGLREAIAHFGGNVKRVAAYFGRDRKQIYRWAAQYGIDVAALREKEEE